ncbi:MAG: 5-(carboxyamino)imidazole ribonucleotide synthase, partial [Armatimonadetes bacterium]|nr:5-(carboxyamino)imidazole ribonucleotide synthase [Armatimonadota bacterium]
FTLLGRPPQPTVSLNRPPAPLPHYGKRPRPGRNVGHVTLRAGTEADLREPLESLHALIGETR